MTEPAATPLRPDPWATTEPREAMRDNNAAIVVSLSPSVNLTPIGSTMVPVPYNVMDFAGHDDGYTPSVRFTSQRAMVLRSRTQHVHGDAAGTGGGVASGTVGGITEPIEHAAQVRAEGSHVIRHLDRCWMNNRNTVGEAIFVRDTAIYPAPVDRDPLPGSVRLIRNNLPDATPGLFERAPPPVRTPPFRTLPRPPAGLSRLPALRLGRPDPTIGWPLGSLAGDELRRQMEGRDGEIAKDIYIDQELRVPRGTGQADAIIEADGWLPYVGYEGDIRFANHLLSLKAGRIVDFRTMDPDELRELMNRPWPSADEIRENERKLQEEKKHPVPFPIPRKEPGTRVTPPPCRSETICFDRKGTTDPSIPIHFEEQLQMQQDALNAKTPAQVVASIPADGTVARLRPIALSAQNRARNSYIAANQQSYIAQHGQQAWDDHISHLAALHRLDMVAGGDPTDIVGMGDVEANRSIGPQWTAERRRGALRKYAAEMAATKGCPMDIRLSVC